MGEDNEPSQTFNEVVGIIVIFAWIGVFMISPLLFLVLGVVLFVFGIGYLFDKAINYFD